MLFRIAVLPNLCGGRAPLQQGRFPHTYAFRGSVRGPAEHIATMFCSVELDEVAAASSSLPVM